MNPLTQYGNLYASVDSAGTRLFVQVTIYKTVYFIGEYALYVLMLYVVLAHWFDTTTVTASF